MPRSCRPLYFFSRLLAGADGISCAFSRRRSIVLLPRGVLRQEGGGLATAATGSGRTPATPKAAAVAGVVFSVLMIAGLGTVRYVVPTDLTAPAIWLADPTRRNAVGFALSLVSFGGIAFLWFMGVLRNRLGELEDQFFSTVFFGSGLLFVANLFAAAAVSGALLNTVEGGNVPLADSGGYYFERRMGYLFLHVFATKMAGVFTFSICTIALRTGILPRWMAFLGFASGLVMLAIVANWEWIALLFPFWVLLVSVYILAADLRRPAHSRLEGEQWAGHAQ